MLNKGHRGSSLLVLLLNASMHKHVEVEIHTQTLCDAMQTMGLKRNLNSPFYVQYKNKTLVIVYQNTTLLPTGDFYYSQTSSRDSEVASGKEADRNGAMLFWIYVSVSGLLFILIVAMTIAAIVSKDREGERERRGEKGREGYIT